MAKEITCFECGQTVKFVNEHVDGFGNGMFCSDFAREKAEEKGDKKQDQLTYLNGLVLDMFIQACSIDTSEGVKYSHDCISTWEEAQEYLIAAGLLDPKDCQYV